MSTFLHVASPFFYGPTKISTFAALPSLIFAISTFICYMPTQKVHVVSSFVSRSTFSIIPNSKKLSSLTEACGLATPQFSMVLSSQTSVCGTKSPSGNKKQNQCFLQVIFCISYSLIIFPNKQTTAGQVMLIPLRHT